MVIQVQYQRNSLIMVQSHDFIETASYKADRLINRERWSVIVKWKTLKREAKTTAIEK